MKTKLVGAMLLVAASAAAAPDDPTYPVPTDPDPTQPTTDQTPAPDPIPTPDPAQEPVALPPAPEPTPVPTIDPAPPAPVTNVNIRLDNTQAEERWMNRAGFALSLGGGVQGFVGDTMRSTTQDGGMWDVRASFGTRLPLSLEANYLGSAQSINSLGLDSNAILVGNGVQGNLRINATTGDIPVQPFLYGGVAWRRYQLQNSDFNTSDVVGEDDVLEIPVGIGVAYKAGSLLLDARGEFRGAFYENLVPAGGLGSDAFTDPASLSRWGVNANVGVEF